MSPQVVTLAMRCYPGIGSPGPAGRSWNLASKISPPDTVYLVVSLLMGNDEAFERERIRRFVLDNLLLGDSDRMPSDAESLLEAGVIDSTGILELIEFLEDAFGITVEDTETVPENLDGVERILGYLGRKQG